MHPDIQKLIELQKIDIHLADLRGRLNAIPQQIAEVEKGVVGARQQLSAIKEALTNSLTERKKFEMDVESWKEKARKYRGQGSEVKTNEAYKALQHEVEHAEREAAQAEDRLLERMMAGEQFERNVKVAEAALVSVERDGASERQKLIEQQNALRAEVTEQEAERHKIVPQIDENLLRTYDNVARRRHGIALSEVKGDSCTQCGMMVRPHVVQELRRADSTDIFQCETCTRMLYWVEPPHAAPLPVTPKEALEDPGPAMSDPPGGEGG
jgi:predicted  nucleic acid-binding Zn-ribbon protein